MSFCLQGTMDLLWKARMSVLPEKDDVCVRIVDGVETEYEVIQVRFEFLHTDVAEVTGYVGGVPQYGDYVPSAVTQTAPVVVVSAV